MPMPKIPGLTGYIPYTIGQLREKKKGKREKGKRKKEKGTISKLDPPHAEYGQREFRLADSYLSDGVPLFLKLLYRFSD